MTTQLRRAAPPRRRAVRRLLIGLAVVMAVLLLAGGLAVWRIWATADGLQRADDLLPARTPAPAGTPGADGTAAPTTGTPVIAGSLNYVLMGSDINAGGEEGRSDVLMVAHVPPTRDKVYVISFPRDMWVTIPGRGMAKINAAYAYGGPALTTRTVESLVGVQMDHAAKIDYEGFVGMTTELGGVTVQNKVASTKQVGGTTYTWPAGPITLQGEEALQYVRQRYELPHGDLDRAERQRAMVRAILGKLMSRDVLTNPAKIAGVMGSLGRFVTVDAGLTNDVLFSTATSMRVDSGDDIVLLQAPLSGFGRSPDGQSIDLVNQPQLAEMSQAIKAGTMADYAAKYKDQPLAGNR